MLYHEQNSEAVIKELSSNSVSGLTAEQALQRQTQYGENKLKEKKKKTREGTSESPKTEPKEWVQGLSPEGYTYYYNTKTGGKKQPGAKADKLIACR